MRRKAGAICMALGLWLIISALCLLAYNRWDNWRAGQTVADIQDALEDAENEHDGLPAAGGSNETDHDDEMDTIEIDGYDYIGTLSIPSYGLQLPVMSEWSYPGLKIAPGRYSGSVWTDDMVICGHNYERHFGNLINLEEGDSITFTDVDGNVFEYQVKELITLNPADVEEMTGLSSGKSEEPAESEGLKGDGESGALDASNGSGGLNETDLSNDLDGSNETGGSNGSDEWDLTLFTCTVGGQARVTVRCIRVG